MGKHGKHRALVTALALALGGGPASAACRLALALGFDVSRSVDAADYAIQREGILAALESEEIVDALLKPEDRVALAVFEWSGAGYQEVVVGWTEIASEADLAGFRAAIARHARASDRLATALGGALVFGRDLLGERPECGAWTLDISGDGQNNEGSGPERVYGREDFGEITVNGLAIGGHERDIAVYFRERMIRGPGAFVEVAATHEDFPAAFRRKLERELTERVMGSAEGSGWRGPG